ncbi:hypothetical protein J1605_005491 [Eschrichtius robustus]|uniref:Uncharacterized protein n=1 Tax=Eschrichtius robustus TaxID=9764 RepID=A0AB34H5X3_ESCRO|nr:hypothetical protein J1605_005491 [Eschrichtius robustus]
MFQKSTEELNRMEHFRNLSPASAPLFTQRCITLRSNGFATGTLICHQTDSGSAPRQSPWLLVCLLTHGTSVVPILRLTLPPAYQDPSQSLLPGKPNVQKENRETSSCSTTYADQKSI